MSSCDTITAAPTAIGNAMPTSSLTSGQEPLSALALKTGATSLATCAECLGQHSRVRLSHVHVHNTNWLLALFAMLFAFVLGARCGESRSPVLYPGLEGAQARDGPWATPRGEASFVSQDANTKNMEIDRRQRIHVRVPADVIELVVRALCEVQLEKQLCERCAERFDTAFKSWHSSFLTIIPPNSWALLRP